MSNSLQDEIAKAVNKAKVEGCWFFNSRTKEWLTPEEYENFCKTMVIQYGDSNRDIFVSFYISDPKEGIRSRMAYIKKASVELQQFTEKVMAYYNLVGKNMK